MIAIILSGHISQCGLAPIAGISLSAMIDCDRFPAAFSQKLRSLKSTWPTCLTPLLAEPWFESASAGRGRHKVRFHADFASGHSPDSGDGGWRTAPSADCGASQGNFCSRQLRSWSEPQNVNFVAQLGGTVTFSVGGSTLGSAPLSGAGVGRRDTHTDAHADRHLVLMAVLMAQVAPASLRVS